MTGSNEESSLEAFGLAMRDRRWVENVASEAEVAGIVDRIGRGLDEGGIGIGILNAYAPGAGVQERFQDEDTALARARSLAGEAAAEQALESGAAAPAISVEETILAPQIEGRRQLVEAVITATASGRPRIAGS